MRKAVIFAAALLLAGCAYPVTRADQGAADGLIYFPGAAAGAQAIIDGADAGPASQYDGKQFLSVHPGTHQFALSLGGQKVLDKKYYVGSGSRIAVQ